MAIITKEDFQSNFTITPGDPLNNFHLNKGAIRNKLELDILNQNRLFNLYGTSADIDGWDPFITYESEQLVKYNSVIYKALNTNINSNPSSDVVNWEVLNRPFYTTTEVDNIISGLSYYTTTEVNNLISTNNASYYTSTEVDSIISGLSYYTTAEVDSIISGLSYYTTTEVDGIISGLGAIYYPLSNPNGYTDDLTPTEILDALKTVDSDTSGLNCNTLQGYTALSLPVSTPVQSALDLKANADNAVLTGSPTAQSPASSSNDTSIATTDFVKIIAGGIEIPDISKTPSGHAKLASGLILQWGEIATTVSTEFTVNFTTTFPNLCASIMVTMLNNVNNDAASAMYVKTKSTTSFTGYSSSNTDATAMWVAIGY